MAGANFKQVNLNKLKMNLFCDEFDVNTKKGDFSVAKVCAIRHPTSALGEQSHRQMGHWYLRVET
jgi:hypothetical protein